MANRSRRRRFGSIRKRASGRYQARYRAPDGTMRSAPQTFARKSEAEQYLALIEAQMVRREWVDPDRAKIRIQDYAERWIAHRPGLRPRTAHLYGYLLRRHIAPYLGGVPLGVLDTAMIREWRAELLSAGVSQTTAAKAYRLLRAVLMTAVKEDELIRVNPCRIPGADQERAPERPILTISQVVRLAEEMPERFRALVLLATFACLRWGEVWGLQRKDIDLQLGTVRVRQSLSEITGRGLVIGPPKSRAGRRVVSIPEAVIPAIRDHMDRYVPDDPDAFVFTGPEGGHVWRGNFIKLANWKKAGKSIGVPDLHFHDLRHTGNTLASQTGASLRDLMTRMGHDSPRAALIYQHASTQADRRIADAVSALMDLEASGQQGEQPGQPESIDDEDPDDGAAGALVRAG